MSLKISDSPLGLIDDVTGALAGLRASGVDYALPALPLDSSGNPTGQFKAADGTAALPSYGFTSEPGFGFYRQASGAVRWAAGGTDFAQFDITTIRHRSDTGAFQIGSSSADYVNLTRDAAHTLAQRNGTNAQAFRVYNMYTDASNYERAGVKWAGNIATIGTENGGTGVARNFYINSAGGIIVLQSQGFDKAFITGSSFQPTAIGGLDLGDATHSWKRLYMDYTNTATVGAVTINKAAGRVNIAAAGTSVVVTNSLVTAASNVIVQLKTTDATAKSATVIEAAGSFTITLNAAATGQVAIGFTVINTD